MISNKQELLNVLDGTTQTPALRRVHALTAAPTTQIDFYDGRLVRADEIAGIWKVRLLTANHKKRRYLGLSSLVRELAHVQQGSSLQQIALRNGLTTGLFFYEPEQQRTVGAVISVRTPADVARSWDNLRSANGEHGSPTRKQPTRTRREAKSAPIVAALKR